jgi:hypothetical protein
MHTKNILQTVIYRRLLYLVHNLMGLILVFSIGACSRNHLIKDITAATDIMGIKIPHTLLIEQQSQPNIIEVIFQINDQVNHSRNKVRLEDFMLKVDILEQETFAGTTDGNQISYKDGKGKQQTFSKTFKKSLTEFTNLVELDLAHGHNELKVYFDLVPASEVIKVKLNFELLHITKKTIQNIDVVWIKSPLVINIPTKFVGQETSFNLKSLTGIKDLNKIKLQLKSQSSEGMFQFEKTKSAEATLAELLDGTDELANDQETNPIKVVVDNQNEAQEGEFTILVFTDDDVADNPTLGEKKVQWANLMPNPELKQEEEELAKSYKGEQVDKQELNQLKEQKKTLKKQIKQVDNKVKAEKKLLKEKLKKDLEELELKKNVSLKGKSPEEKKLIEQEYKRQKEELLTAAGVSPVKQELKNKVIYSKGFANAMGNNMLGTPLQESQNPLYAKGQEAGHKTSKVVGRGEATIAATLASVGVATLVAGTGPTLGVAAAGSAVMIGAGAGGVVHGLATTDRAEANLAKLKEKKEKEKDADKDKTALKNTEELKDPAEGVHIIIDKAAENTDDQPIGEVTKEGETISLPDDNTPDSTHSHQ